MVSNHFTKRRANRGTPPVCKSKPTPPLPPPPYTCNCTLKADYDPPGNFIYATLDACTSLAPAGTPLGFYITCTPPLTPQPPTELLNCTQPGTQLFNGALPGVTYKFRAEVFFAYQRICALWAIEAVP
jgi:hypothetical protein